MDQQYLAKLKEQQAAIEGALEYQRSYMQSKPFKSFGVNATVEIYIRSLESALLTISSIITFLEDEDRSY